MRENSTDAERSGMSSSVDNQDQKKGQCKKGEKGGKADGGEGNMSPVSEDGYSEL